MDITIEQLKEKVKTYQEVLQNTESYRQEWQSATKALITTTLNQIISETALKARVIERSSIDNLEAVILDLGHSSSGLAESLDNTDVKRIMIKKNGAIIYQQLFNGKIMVMIENPHIEGYGDPKAPISLAILRPDEISTPVIYEHVIHMLGHIIEWEDYDDDDKGEKIAFQPIGFRHTLSADSNESTANQ